jgi:hypothetical protein
LPSRTVDARLAFQADQCLDGKTRRNVSDIRRCLQPAACYETTPWCVLEILSDGDGY